MGQRQYFRIEDFSGGYNPDQGSLLIADNQAVLVRDFRLDKVGSLVARKGYSKFITDTTPDDILTVGRWDDADDPADSEVVVQTTTGELRRLDTAGGGDVQLSTAAGTTAGEFAPLAEYLAFVAPAIDPLKFSQDAAGAGWPAVSNIGLDAPTVAPVASSTTGTLTGDYEYAYTFYHSYHGIESNPSVVDAITLSSQGASITFANGAQTDKVRIYRTTDGGSTLLRIAEVDDTTSPYVDSGDPDGSIVAPFDHDPPGQLEHIAYHQGYAFGSIGNTLYWSKALEEEYWPILNQTEVPFEGNDSITALVSFQDVLLIFGRYNTLILSGSGGFWSITRDDISLGAVSDRAISEVNHQLVVLTGEGLKVWPGYEPLAPQLDRLLAGLAHSVLVDASMVHVPSERSLYVSVNSKTYAIHLPNQSVSEFTINALQWLEGGSDGFSDPLLVLPADDTLKQWGGAEDDDGVAIPVMWRSKPYRFTNPESTKHLRRIGAYATQGTAANVTVVISDTSRTHTVTLDAVSETAESVWGTMEWNTDSWAGDEQISYFIGAMPAQTLLGRIVQLTLSASISSALEIAPPFTIEFRESNRFLGA
jgi:hypothetical protein